MSFLFPSLNTWRKIIEIMLLIAKKNRILRTWPDHTATIRQSNLVVFFQNLIDRRHHFDDYTWKKWAFLPCSALKHFKLSRFLISYWYYKSIKTINLNGGFIKTRGNHFFMDDSRIYVYLTTPIQSIQSVIKVALRWIFEFVYQCNN